jgi:integrase
MVPRRICQAGCYVETIGGKIKLRRPALTLKVFWHSRDSEHLPLRKSVKIGEHGDGLLPMMADQHQGKGNKARRCPLWPQSVRELVGLVQGRDPSDHVFLNRCGQPITRFGIHTLVERCATRAMKDVPSLATKRVSPHTIRHTTATHLLRSGVDINTIRAWLGHVSLTTTNVYAEVDLEMKAKALAGCEVSDPQPSQPWREDEGLMAFLCNL